MAIGYDSYKFPEVKFDKQANYPNAAGNIKKITVEEWNDILHHTHSVGTFVDNNGEFVDPSQDGSGSGSGISLSEFNELKESVNNIKTTVETIHTVEEYDDTEIKSRLETLESKAHDEYDHTELINKIAALEEENTNLKSTLQSLVSRVTSLENNPSSDGLLIDYDLDTPGTQDADGNTIDG